MRLLSRRYTVRDLMTLVLAAAVVAWLWTCEPDNPAVRRVVWVAVAIYCGAGVFAVSVASIGAGISKVVTPPCPPLPVRQTGVELVPEPPPIAPPPRVEPTA